MVFVAFLLLTVSTLAVHGKPTGDSVDCVEIGGWTYCTKPDHYPQSEIDQSIADSNNIKDWPEECKGKSYCHIKPAYYPTETFTKLLEGMKFDFEQIAEIGNRSSEVDVADYARRKPNLNPLQMAAHLMNMSNLEDWSVKGNCAMDIIPSFTPYTMSRGQDLIYIVQSRFFKQSIPVVKCNGKNKKKALESRRHGEYYECFKDFVPPGETYNTECQQRTITTSLHIYIDNEVRPLMTEIDADCVCGRKERY